MVRAGRLTPEEAEVHPQRSIITRALGPEADVEVERMTYPARAGDVYLICSDGLTTMIPEDAVAGILRGRSSLDGAAEELVRAANEAGGRDNITVVLFKLGDGDAGESDQPTMIAPPSSDARPAPRRPEPARAAPRRRSARRWVAAAVVVVAVVAIGVGFWAGSRQFYFVGTDDRGLVTLYRGLPYELPFGLELWEEEYSTAVPGRSLPETRRDNVLDHSLRSKGDAVDLIKQVERGELED
jgi:protein phosphatase